MNRMYTGLSVAILILLGTVFLSCKSTPADTKEEEPKGRVLTHNAQGYHEGFFFSFWSDTQDRVTMTLEENGTYSSVWNGVNNWVGGTGWKPGATRLVAYEADYVPQGNSYLALYGWTRNPLIEYYVVESWGSWRPPGGSPVGMVESDGGVYDIYTTQRVNQPSIEGTRTFTQFWSVRRSRQTSGVITVKNHFDAWEAFGMTLGRHDYQVMATEGYKSSGRSRVAVWEVDQ